MSLPGNGIFVLRGEISTLMTAIKRGTRWNSSNYQVMEFKLFLLPLTSPKKLKRCLQLNWNLHFCFNFR